MPFHIRKKQACKQLLGALLLINVAELSAVGQGNCVSNGGFDTDASGWLLQNGAVFKATQGNPPGCIVLNGYLATPTASQEIHSLTPGQRYVITGDYYGGGAPKVTPNGFGVAVDGAFILTTNAPTSDSWYSFSVNWQANSTDATLSMSAQLNGTVYPYSIDNITMQPIPEPSSALVVLLGGVVLFHARKRGA